jgi:hypothetical protein
LVGLLGRVVSPVARPLPSQSNTNTEETRTHIHASSGIRTHDPSVWAGDDINLHVIYIRTFHRDTMILMM